MRRYGACLLPVEAWRSLVARLLREQEVVGSSPVASTTLPNKPFLLVWLFCCVRLTKKPNVALGAVWQTSFYGMLNFVTLRELSSLAAPSLPLLASPVASTNVETRLFCKESAFLRTLFAFLKNFLHYFISSMTTTLSKGVTNDDFETLFPETDKT